MFRPILTEYWLQDSCFYLCVQCVSLRGTTQFKSNLRAIPHIDALKDLAKSTSVDSWLDYIAVANLLTNPHWVVIVSTQDLNPRFNSYTAYGVDVLVAGQLRFFVRGQLWFIDHASLCRCEPTQDPSPRRLELWQDGRRLFRVRVCGNGGTWLNNLWFWLGKSQQAAEWFAEGVTDVGITV